MNSKILSYWLAAFYLQNIGSRTIMHWLTQFPNIQALFTASDEDRRLKGFSEKQITALQNINWALIDSDLNWVEKNNHTILHFDHPDYPPLLKQIYDPPLILFVKGNATILSQQQVAIVGSRQASASGIINAKKFSYALADAGLIITSGLALGVDGASHEGALSAKGYTIGVAGTGLNTVYPKSHAHLVEKIIENQGAIISEFPLNTAPNAGNFPRRNRIIGGLCLGVLVIEAALKSGSLITARFALENSREVFAIPGSIHNPLARGCHHLIRQGAKLVETVDDILEELRSVNTEISQEKSLKIQENSSNLLQNQRDLLNHIDYEVTSMDVILLRSRLTASEVSSILLILELNGYIQSVSGGYVRVM